MNSSTLQHLDKQHWIHSLSNWRNHERDGVHILKSGSGVFFKDSSGEEYLDAFSGLWCVNAGYGQKSIVEAAAKQMLEMPYAQSYNDTGCEPAILLASKLAARAPGDCTHVYFTLSGSDSIDSALRFIQYHSHVTGQPERRHIISLERGYHGTSSTGAGVTSLPIFHQNFDAPTSFQHRIPSPFPYRHEAGPDGQSIIDASVASLRAKIHEIGPTKVAALFCEPIQGAGSVIVPPTGFLPAMRKVCDEYGILLVIDEVITGFGRTGPLFACETESVAPDLMTIAKGLTSSYVPMGALLVSDRVYQRIAEKMPKDTPFGHGSTYSGHPVSAAVGLEVLRLYEEGGLLENGKQVGNYLQERLQAFRDHPLVGDVRGRSMVAGIELVANKQSKQSFDPSGLPKKIMDIARMHKLMVRAFGDGTIALAPALCMTISECDLMLTRLSAVLDDLVPALRK